MIVVGAPRRRWLAQWAGNRGSGNPESSSKSGQSKSFMPRRVVEEVIAGFDEFVVEVGALESGGKTTLMSKGEAIRRLSFETRQAK